MARYAALLRGINVGRARRVPMAELRDLAGSLGWSDVATYLQSGNLLLTTELGPDEVAAQLQAGLADRFEHDDIEVAVRTAEQVAAVVAADAFVAAGADEQHVAVCFPAATPDGDAVATLLERDHGDERLAVLPTGDLQLLCPGGFHAARLTNVTLERHLGVRATTRNWRTTLALRDRL